MSAMQTKQIKGQPVSKSVAEKKREIVRLNLNVEKPFYRKIKQRVLDEDTTITELVIKAIEKYLEE